MTFWICFAFSVTAFGIGIILGLALFADKWDKFIEGGKDHETEDVK